MKLPFLFDAPALITHYGSPLYVYNTGVIAKQYARLAEAFKTVKTRINYACKANTNPELMRFIHGLGAGLDTVSLNEIHIGMRCGFQPAQIIFTPNSVSMHEIHEAVKLGVHINVDNISILEQVGEHYGSSLPVCIRINPHVMGGGNYNISTGHIDSKFGISIHQMRHVERIVQHYSMKVNGLHMHTGSDILDTDIFLRAADILFDCAASFADLTYLDFGSGFKVAYKPDDYETDLEELGQKLSERFQTFCTNYGRELELWFEPGKFLVSESGVFLTTVNVLKQTTSAMFVGVDTGLNHLIRPMFYNAYHTILNLSNPDGKQRIYTVVGNICETDTFASDRRLAEVREGDVLAFLNAGAYGFSMASNYNSRPRPAEVAVNGTDHKLIRRRETLDDILKTSEGL